MKYFDLHCDTPYECYRTGQEFIKNSLAVSACKGQCFTEWSQVFAIWIKDDEKHPYELYRSILSDFSRKIFNCPSNLHPLFSVEGGAVIEDKIERVEILKRDGICALTLTWNGTNRIAGGVNSNQGLTDFGRSVISEMNRVGMACDLSHLNPQSFDAVLEVSSHPFISHANCSAVFEHPRNITDERIKRVAARGGVIGLCFYPAFVGEPIFEGLYRQILHLLDLGLDDAIAIGSDFDGGVMASELNSVGKVVDFAAFLRRKGMSEDVLSKIFYTNAQKFFVCL
ncbi:MAG: membrane dipeptidase [Clostridia bacterium]|nr:membrane dipeptidase [Clostridia bacterium]